MTTGRDVWCLRHGEDGELGSKLERQLRLQLLNSPCEVAYAEESSRVDLAALIDVIPVNVPQACGRQIDSAARNYSILDSDILNVVILQITGGLNLDQTPAPIAPTMQNVHAHQHAAVLEHALKNCRRGLITK